MERKELQPFRDACPKPWSGEKHREFNRPELKGQMREAYVLTSEAWTFPTRFTWTVGTQITEGQNWNFYAYLSALQLFLSCLQDGSYLLSSPTHCRCPKGRLCAYIH